MITDDRPGIGLTVARPAGVNGPDAAPVVTAVESGSPAADAGIEPGDQVLSITPAVHDRDTTSAGPAVVDELAAHRAGDRLTITLTRRDQQVTVHLRPVMIENTVAAPGSTPPTGALLGVGIDTTSSTLGATIATVTAGSPAADGGLVVGDTIIKFGVMPVIDILTLQDALLGSAGALTDVTVLAPNGATETLRIAPTPAPADDPTQPVAYLL